MHRDRGTSTRLAALAVVILLATADVLVGSRQVVGIRQAFDTVSVRQGPVSGNTAIDPLTMFRRSNNTLRELVQFAYQRSRPRTVNTIPWVDSVRWDVEGTVRRPFASRAELRILLQRMLVDRFGLQVHSEQRERDAIVLSMAKPGVLGPGMREVAKACRAVTSQNGPFTVSPVDAAGRRVCDAFGGRLRGGMSNIVLRGTAFDELVRHLERLTDTVVVDETGIDADFDVDLELPKGWQPGSQIDDVPSFLESVKRQLGLTGTIRRVKVSLLVIDKARQP